MFDNKHPQPPEADPDDLGSLRRSLFAWGGFTVFWWGLLSIFLAPLVGSIAKTHRARRSYRSVEGVVLSSRMDRHQHKDNHRHYVKIDYDPVIRYAYEVDGRRYVSTQYAYSTPDDHSAVAPIVKTHPPGRRVPVYYDIDDPAEAVLDRSVSSSHAWRLLFLQPFLVAGVGMILMLITLPGRHRRLRDFASSETSPPWAIPDWGVLTDEGGLLTVRPNRSVGRAFQALLMGYGFICFAAVVVLAVATETDELTWNTIETITAAALLAGCAAAVSCIRPLSKATVTFDLQQRTLSLRSRRRRFELAFDEIAQWRLRALESTEHMDEDIDRRTRRILLEALPCTGGDPKPVHIFHNSRLFPAANRPPLLIGRRVQQAFAEITSSEAPEQIVEPDPRDYAKMWKSSFGNEYRDLR